MAGATSAPPTLQVQNDTTGPLYQSLQTVGQTTGAFSHPVVLASDQSTVPTKGTAGLGSLTAVPAGTTNGTALGTLPTGAQGARLYLPTGTSMTFTVLATAPSAAPSATFTVSQSTTGPNWDENLSGGQMIYVTAVTGSPLFRWY